jgi:hypothetical protein
MKSPFKFLDSYNKDDRNIFFGREREIEELYHRVFESKIMLVYGVSGSGKSSLIHCGLANKFSETDWLPILIRRGENIIEGLAKGINNTSITAQITNLKTPADFKKGVRSLYLDHYKPVYFIFDQFEELFIFGDKEERRSFVQIVKSLNESDLQCRMIFVMREEYMAGVTEFEKYIPTFFSNRVRIEKMAHINALDAINGPSKFANISLEQGFAEALLDKLSPENNDVELTYLQVFLDKIFRLSNDEKVSEKASNQLTFTLALVEKTGNVSDILGSFLEEQLKEMDEPDSGLTILKSFVTIKGTKKQLTKEEVVESSRAYGKDIPAEIVSEFLQKFINIRILRDKDDNGQYELRHDSLALKIFEKITIVEKEMMEIYQFLENALTLYQKRKVLLSSNDLNYISPYEDRLFINKEIGNLVDISKRELNKVKRRIKRVAISGFIAIMIFSIGSIMMVYRLPFNPQIRLLGFIMYIVWFLPVFSYYVLKTRDNRGMNILFMIFTLLFVGNIYLFSTNTRHRVRALLITPAIQSEQKANEEIERYKTKSDSIYSMLNKVFDKYPDKIGNIKYESENVKQRADELDSYIQDIKIEIVTKTEGPETDAVNGRDVIIAKITRLDDYNVSSEILIGSRNNGIAYALSRLIIDYKDFLIYMVKNDEIIVTSINNALNLENQEINDSETGSRLMESWEHYTFQRKPIVFVMNTLSQIQADIKYCESEVITYLYNKMLQEIEPVYEKKQK